MHRFGKKNSSRSPAKSKKKTNRIGFDSDESDDDKPFRGKAAAKKKNAAVRSVNPRRIDRRQSLSGGVTFASNIFGQQKIGKKYIPGTTSIRPKESGISQIPHIYIR